MLSLDLGSADEAGPSNAAAGAGGVQRFPLAAQPEVMRAAEKDDQYASFIYEACRDAFRQLFGTRVAVAYQNETKLLGQMLYYVLTTGAGQQTLGEEYCDITQVHFAATKDSLSRHFNKFGDVLKVVILTDAGTGQPKGSAYVEFMRKEAAEHALSLDGTSFMSCILKESILEAPSLDGQVFEAVQQENGEMHTLLKHTQKVVDECAYFGRT